MLKKIFSLFALAVSSLVSFEKLPEDFTIAFGNQKASETITEFFSFSCHKCIDHFRHDFPKIKTALIDTEKVYWIYHPFPNSMVTLKAMMCLEKLDAKERQAFLFAYFSKAEGEDEEAAIALMKKVMKKLGKPADDLDDRLALKSSRAARASVRFLSLGPPIEGIPAIEFRGEVIKAPNGVSLIEMVNYSP